MELQELMFNIFEESNRIEEEMIKKALFDHLGRQATKEDFKKITIYYMGVEVRWYDIEYAGTFLGRISRNYIPDFSGKKQIEGPTISFTPAENVKPSDRINSKKP